MHVSVTQDIAASDTEWDCDWADYWGRNYVARGATTTSYATFSVAQTGRLCDHVDGNNWVELAAPEWEGECTTPSLAQAAAVPATAHQTVVHAQAQLLGAAAAEGRQPVTLRSYVNCHLSPRHALMLSRLCLP